MRSKRRKSIHWEYQSHTLGCYISSFVAGALFVMSRTANIHLVLFGTVIEPSILTGVSVFIFLIGLLRLVQIESRIIGPLLALRKYLASDLKEPFFVRKNDFFRDIPPQINEKLSQKPSEDTTE